MKDLAQKFDYPASEFYKLDRMKAALEKLGHPELGRKTILVAGTNGKGSVVSFLSGLLQRSGYRVGTYISPHILRANERIQIDGEEISDDLLSEIENQNLEVLKDLTYFEKWTAMSFVAFAKANVDWQVIEVGMGGRLDATNLCDPDISVICRLGLDHQNVLGDRLSKIAFEKAGIMRNSRSCFAFRPDRRDAESVLVEHAQSVDACLKFLDEQELPEKFETLIQSDLADRPEWQKQNARLAVSVFLEAMKNENKEIPESLFDDFSFAQREFSARTQILKKSPLLIVEGGHNALAISELNLFLEKNYPDKKFNAVYGCLEERDPIEILRAIDFRISRYLTLSFFSEREISPKKIKENIDENFNKQCLLMNDFPALIEKIKNSEEPWIIFGSFYLAGEFLKAWEKRNESRS